MPPMLFDDDQSVALQTAATVTTVAEDATRALATLRQVMPSRLRHRIDLLRITAVQPPAARDTCQVDTQALVDLSRAIHAREELRFDYTPGPSTSAGNVRRVQPHHLVTWRNRWYLVAWDVDRENWRTFRVDRIRPCTPTGPRFTPRELPGGATRATPVTAAGPRGTDRRRAGGDQPAAGSGRQFRTEDRAQAAAAPVPFQGGGGRRSCGFRHVDQVHARLQRFVALLDVAQALV